MSLIGAGGVGKTRLGVELGRLAAGRYDEVMFCDLAPIDDPAAIQHALAETLGVRSQPRRSTVEAIVEWLADRHVLLIVDNCEHLTPSVSSLVDLLLTRCPGVNVVATSRERLGVSGEHVWMVPPLADDADRAQLFCDRAVAADATIVFGPDDMQTVRGICRQLDGLPLAIELAAPKLRYLSLQQMNDRLDDRFGLLQGGVRSPGPDRHQTISATIDWSYSLLDDQERACFERLSVFSGQFDLDAVEAVLPGDGIAETDTSNVFGRLVERSLVSVHRAGGQTRYRLLETLRAFAQEHLDQDEKEIWRRRHAHYYVDVADRADALFVSTGWVEGAATFERDWSNIRAALSWSLNRQDLDLASRIVELTSWFAALKVRHEHQRWAHQVLDLAADGAVEPPPAVAGIAAWWAIGQSNAAEQLELAEIGLQSASSPTDPSTNWSWHALTVYHYFYRGDLGAYEADLQSWQQASRRQRDWFHRSLMANYRTLGGSPNQIEQGRALATELARRLPNPSLEVWASWAEGNAAQTNGNFEEAIDAFKRTLELAEAADHRVMDATAARFLIAALAEQGGPLRPVLQLRCLDVLDHHRINVETGLAGLARHLLTEGQAEHAAVLAGYLQTTPMIGPFLEFVEDIDHRDRTTWERKGATFDRGQAIAYAKAVLEAVPRN